MAAFSVTHTSLTTRCSTIFAARRISRIRWSWRGAGTKISNASSQRLELIQWLLGHHRNEVDGLLGLAQLQRERFPDVIFQPSRSSDFYFAADRSAASRAQLNWLVFNRIVKERGHHLVLSRLAETDSLRRIGVVLILRRIVEVTSDDQRGTFLDRHRLFEVIKGLPGEAIVRHVEQ